MIFSVLQEQDKQERMAIIKMITLMLAQKPPLTEQQLEFLEHLGIHAELSESEMAVCMRLDMRENWEFQHVFDDTLSLNAQKILLFIAKLAEYCFERRGGLLPFSNKKEKLSYIEKHISPSIHISSPTKGKISRCALEFFNTSCAVYDAIYTDTIDKKILSKTPYDKKLFILDYSKVDELKPAEALVFLQEFENIMLEHAKGNSRPEGMLVNQLIGPFHARAAVRNENKEKLVINGKEIEKFWLKKLLLMFAISCYEFHGKPQEDNRIQKIITTQGIDEKLVEKRLLPVVEKHMEACIKSFEHLHEVRNTDFAGQDNTSKYMQTAFATVGFVSNLYAPAVAAKGVFKLGQKALDLSDSLTTDEDRDMERIHGLRHVTRYCDAHVIHICVDGFMTESSKAQFTDWKLGFEELGVKGGVIGFAWPSCNTQRLEFSSWYNAVISAKKYGTRLAKDIELLKKINPALEVKLYGHSLGSRIIHHALLRLMKDRIKIKEAYLFGGAVSRHDKSGWTGALQSVEGCVYNFYSHNDDTLRWLYCPAQLNDSPIGLGEIEFHSTKGLQQATLINKDVTSIISGHKEYKPNLAFLMEELIMHE